MYTSFYHLQGKPFQLSPDPKFFFGSTGHKRAMSYLRYGLSQGEGFIVITGGIGTGKTTLVRNLFSELDRDRVVAAQLVTTQLESEDMLRMIVGAFGLDAEAGSKATLIKRFEDFLKNCAREGQRVLLVVDEAQNLPARSLEELRMLSNFQVWNTPLLQSFLLGQEEFRATLQSDGLEQLRQRIIASCHLSPLSLEETREYMEHRLTVVGWKNDPRFGSDAYQRIHRLSGGIPRKINVLCDRLLLFGFLEERRELDGAAVDTVAEELAEELQPARDGGESPRRPPAADSGEDLSELDALLSSLGSGSDSGSPDVRRLSRRVDQLEETVESLRRGFVQLSRLLGKR